MSRCEQLLHLWIFCDQAWIRGLPIDETNQFLDPQSFVGITTVYQNLRFWFVRSHVVSDVFLIERGMVFLVTKSSLNGYLSRKEMSNSRRTYRILDVICLPGSALRRSAQMIPFMRLDSPSHL